MNLNIALFVNDKVGLNVTKYLFENNENIKFLFLHDSYNQKEGDLILNIFKRSKPKVFYASEVDSEECYNSLKCERIDFIITVYWAYLLKPKIYNLAKNTINFHPALLPINRGWYPHVFSLIYNQPFGVTLHQIDETADTGDIYIQKEVFPSIDMDASQIYWLLQDEIFDLFVKNWEKIKSGKYKLKKQNERKSNYRKKSEIKKYDKINLNKKETFFNFINLIRSRCFGEQVFSFFEYEGQKYSIRISIKKIDDEH